MAWVMEGGKFINSQHINSDEVLREANASSPQREMEV